MLATSLASIALVGAILLTLRGQRFLKDNLSTKLALLLPPDSETHGWKILHEQVATSEEMKHAVAELLNFDDAYLVSFLQHDMRISIYAAYWKPGKMSHRLVATHTPDICWVSAGWKSLKQNTETVSFTTEAKPLMLEHRIFTQQGHMEHVVFSHFVGGRSMSYQTGGHPPWHAIFSDILLRGTDQREEQLFIRISSNHNFEAIKTSLPVKYFLEHLSIEMEKARHVKGKNLSIMHE